MEYENAFFEVNDMHPWGEQLVTLGVLSDDEALRDELWADCMRSPLWKETVLGNVDRSLLGPLTLSHY